MLSQIIFCLVVFPLQVQPFIVPHDASDVQLVVVNTNLSSNHGTMMANLSWNATGHCSQDCNVTLVFQLSAVSFGNHCMSQLVPK